MTVFLFIMLMIAPNVYEVEAMIELDSIESCVEAALIVNNGLSIPQIALCGMETPPTSKPDIVS